MISSLKKKESTIFDSVDSVNLQLVNKLWSNNIRCTSNRAYIGTIEMEFRQYLGFSEVFVRDDLFSAQLIYLRFSWDKMSPRGANTGLQWCYKYDSSAIG